VIAVDTSVVIPALVRWHQSHETCRKAAARRSVPAHALIESYSVLTRLPAPHRLDALVARDLLDAWFGGPQVLVPSKRVAARLVRQLADAGVSGGAAYDGVVALTAADHGATLLTRDTRAVITYEALDVPFELLES
jgi:predicted nucleic acid-binding protein